MSRAKRQTKILSLLTASLASMSFCWGVSVSLGNQAAKQTSPIPIEEDLDWQDLDTRVARLSPDGRFLAFETLRRKNQRLFNGNLFDETGGEPFLAMGEVWIKDLARGTTLQLGSGTDPSWSPDGKFIAFYSARDGTARLWLWDMSSGTSRRLSAATVRHYRGSLGSWAPIQWTPNGDSILTRLLPSGMTIADADKYLREPNESGAALAKGSTVTVYEPPSGTTGRKDWKTDVQEGTAQNWRVKMFLGDLALISVRTGDVQRILPRLQSHQYELSPDGHYVAASDLRAGGSRVLIYSRRDDSVRILASNTGQGPFNAAFTWAPDSQELAYRDRDRWQLFSVYKDASLTVSFSAPNPPVWDRSEHFLYFLDKNVVSRVSLLTGKVEEVVRIDGKNIERIMTLRKSPNSLWSSDGHASTYLTVSAPPDNRRSLYKVDLKTARASELPGQEDEHARAKLLAQLTGETVIYGIEDALHPIDLWLAVPGNAANKRLTNVNPAFQKYELGTVRLIEWLNDEGERRKGAVILPSNYEPGKRCPVVVWVYGSSLLSKSIAQFGGHLGYRSFLFTTRGYAVFFPDSTVHIGTPLRDINSNILSGVSKLVEVGIADPERLAVMGTSYGAYSGLSLVVGSPRFKAAVCYGGIYDLLSFYGGMMDRSGFSEAVDWAENTQGSMGGSPWQYRERYIENSPLLYADRIQTPILIIHGEKDPVPASQADELYIALRRLGKKVEYAKYAGEGHSITFFPNQIDLWSRILEWFDHYLKSEI